MAPSYAPGMSGWTHKALSRVCAPLLLTAGCGGLVVFEEEEQKLSRLERACRAQCEKRQRHPDCYPDVDTCSEECVAYNEDLGEPCDELSLLYLECVGSSPEETRSCNESGLCMDEWSAYQDCRFEAGR